MTGVGVLPSRSLPVGIAFQGGIGALVRINLVGPIKPFPDLAAENPPDRRSRRGRVDPACSVAELRAQRGATHAANDRAGGLLFAILPVLATPEGGDGQHGSQQPINIDIHTPASIVRLGA